MSKTNFKNSLFVAITMFGTLVGAGFASGKEIWVYFARWGPVSYVMIFLTALLFFGASFLFFLFGKKFNIKTVQGAAKTLFGKFSFVAELFVVVSNVVLLSSMFAGAESLCFSGLKIFPPKLFSCLTAIICFVVVCFGFKSVTKANVLIVPLLLTVVLIVFFWSLSSNFESLFFVSKKTVFQSLFSTLLFLGSNMFFSGFIFAKMGKDFQTKELFWGSFIGSMFLFLALFCMTFILHTNTYATIFDMPIIFIAKNISGVFGVLCFVVVWFGLITTALAMLYTVSNWFKAYFGHSVVPNFFITATSLVFSGFGFTTFVSVVYPFLGLFGYVFMFLIIKNLIRQKNDKKLMTSKMVL